MEKKSKVSRVRIQKFFSVIFFLYYYGFSSTANSQVIIQSNHRENSLERTHCPGEVITFNCETRGSRILAWTSDEYIEPGGTRLEFATFDSVGQRQRSPINSNTVATLVNKTNDNGVDILVSTLRITTLSQFMNSSVTCIHTGNGNTTTRTIPVLGDPVGPQLIDSSLKSDSSGTCIALISWIAPGNIRTDDIKHYVVNFDGLPPKYEMDHQKKGFVSAVYNTACNCYSNATYDFNVSAVNRCNRTGVSTPTVTLDPAPASSLDTLVCDQTTESTTTIIESLFLDLAPMHMMIILILMSVISLCVIPTVTLIIIIALLIKKTTQAGKTYTVDNNNNKEQKSQGE